MKTIFVTAIFLRCFTSYILGCPQLCFCHGIKASCVNKKLSYIPEFPPQIQILNFSQNYLPEISNWTFINLTRLHLKKLYISHCQINKVKEWSFSSLKYLIHLDLSSNSFTHEDLTLALESLNSTQIMELFLRFLNIQHTSNLFQSLFGSNLQVLNLGNNFIHFLNGSDYQGLQSLAILDLYENKINSSIFEGLYHIKSLKLTFNRFTSVPKFCPGEQTFRNCIKLSVSGNWIHSFTSSDFPGRCFPVLTELQIGINYASLLPNNIISDLPSLNHFDVRWMNNNELTFEPFAFNSTSLKKLYISNHINSFLQRIDYHNIFRLCPNLLLLEMTKISLSVLPENLDAFQILLSPLTKLEHLFIASTLIWNLPRDVFSNMTNLYTLDMSNNALKTWDEDVFKNLRKLKILRIKSNKISLVNKTSFPEYVLRNIDILAIYDNPFICTCDAYWFRNYIKTHNASFLMKYPKRFICALPANWENKYFSIFDPTYKECHPIGTYIFMAIYVISVLMMFVIMFLVIYRFRLHIKYYIYLLRTRGNYQKVAGDDHDYMYDAFVAYNNNDKIWVISELIPRLENIEHFKLCLHDRDFLIGKLIVDNICDESKKSRKTIIVLSNNFAKSEWCQLEMSLAQARHIRENQNHIIVVLLEDIQTKYMTNVLQVLLTSITYIEWRPDGRENEIFWNRMTAALNSF